MWTTSKSIKVQLFKEVYERTKSKNMLISTGDSSDEEIKDTWYGLLLHWNIHPRASVYSKICWGIKDFNDEWSFIFLKPLHAHRTFFKPFGVGTLKCKIVMFCRQLMLASAKSPLSITEQYDKFIWKWTNLNVLKSRSHSRHIKEKK